MRSRGLALIVVASLATAAACGADAGPVKSSGDGVSGAVVVFAAASLTNAFGEIGEAFEVAHPEATITFNFAASSELVAQIVEGAPADVFASADVTNMTRLIDAGTAADEPVVFAGNRAEIVVAAGNPLGIAGLADLTDPDLVVVTCAPDVPCGSYATQVFDRARVTVAPDSYEENVRAVVTKVRLGEADAGIAYATDVAAAGDAADGVEIPTDVNVVAEYPIAVSAEAPNPRGARAFVDFVLDDAGREILASFGFTSP